MTTITAEEWNDVLFGAADLETGPSGGRMPHRIPAGLRRQLDGDAMFEWVESCSAGVRMRFRTSADRIALTVASTTLATNGVHPPIALVVRQGDDRSLVPLGDPTVVEIDAKRRVTGIRPAAPETVSVAVRPEQPVEIRLPHNARVELISLTADGTIEPSPPSGRRWIHYGSSISQGMDAVAADRTWPAAAASALDWDLRDLSLAGNAQLDGFVARTIRDTAADIITLKIGVNTVNADSFRERTFRPALHAFLDTVRDGHPTTPVVLITAIACPIHEHSPGPVVARPDGMAAAAIRSIEKDDGALTLARTREIIADAVASRGDDALTCIDGRELLGANEADRLYDRLHPDQLGLDLIAERFVAMMR
ncbi:GDSL-type esterase/lipase family protein [Microbacterium aerolatum]|uniref:GDSL-type esterase/lipase family protein n=1 Tax=Microbacterium aerolatum TaxID=153731 RepID=UPI00384B445A